MLTLLINETKPLAGLFASSTGGIGSVPDISVADEGQAVSVQTFTRTAGVITDSFVAGDVLHIGIGDGVNAPVCYIELSSASPATGTMAVNTVGMVALFAATSANQLTLNVGIVRTRGGYTNTIFSAPIVIHRSVIDPDTAVPTPSILGTGVAAALLVAINTALGFVRLDASARLPAVDGSQLTNLPGGVTDGDKGDITVSNSGATWTIDNDTITLAKLAHMPTARVLGRTTAGTGTPELLTISGTGSVAMTTSPTFATPNLDTPSVLVGTNISGTAASLTAGNATLAATVTVANEATDTTCFPVFATAATGSLAAKSNAGLTFNSATGLLSATGLAGAFNGTVGATTPSTIEGTTITGTSSLTLGVASTTNGTIVLKNSANAFTTTIQTGVTGASYTLTLPADDGTASQYLQTDGSGVLSWSTVTSGLTVGITAIASGTTGRILYDNAGVLGELPVGTGVETALAISVGSAGAFITFDGDAGTPSALVGTNISGTAANLTAGLVTSIGDLTGDVTSSNRATTLATVNGNVGAFTNASLTVNAKGLVTAASSGTEAVTSITGTANEITVTGTTTPTLSLPSALTFTGKTVTGGTFDSPTFTTPALGAPASGNFSTGAFTWPTFDQNTAGSAATLTTTRTIGGSSFNGSADVTSFPSPGAIGGSTPSTVAGTTGTFDSALTVGANSQNGTLNVKNSGGSTTASISGGDGSASFANGEVTIDGDGISMGNNYIEFSGTSATIRGGAGYIYLGTNCRTDDLGYFETQGYVKSEALFIPFSGSPQISVGNSTGSAAWIHTDGSASFASGTFTATTSLLLGTAGSAVGTIGFRNATSGTTTLAPATGALGTGTVTLPLSGTLATMEGSNTYTGTTNTFTLPTTTGTTTTSGIAVAANSLTTGTGIYAASSTLTSGKLVDIQVSGTAAAASQTALNIATAGANGTSGITSKGAVISNTHTGTTSTNVALELTASGGATANTALNVTAGQVSVDHNGTGALPCFTVGTSTKNTGLYAPVAGYLGLVGNGAEGVRVSSIAVSIYRACDMSSTLAVTGATTLTGNLTSNGAYISTPQALSGNGAVAAVSVATECTTIANTGTANTTTTLAAGTNGQKKVISFITDGGFDAVITVTNPAWGGAGTITMNDALDNIEMRYLNSVWQVFINNGCTLA